MKKREVYDPREVVLAMIDVQRCFMPAEEGERLGVSGFGELPVEGGHEVVPVLNHMSAYAIDNGIIRATTQDWHPAETAHFGEGDMQWPVHGVAGTPGAEIHPHMQAAKDLFVKRYRKGQEAIESAEQDDSYSGFNAVDEFGETLAEYVKRTNKSLIVIGGLALGGAEFDTCVDSTAIDFATKTEADVIVLEDACRAIVPEEMPQIRAKLEAAGVRVMQSGDLIEGKTVKIGR